MRVGHTILLAALISAAGTVDHVSASSADVIPSTSPSNTFVPRRSSIPSVRKTDYLPRPTSNAALDTTTTTTTVHDDTSKSVSLLRGGSITDLGPALGGALYFFILDIVLRKTFRANNIQFPSQLGGTCIMFITLLLIELVKPGWGDAAFELINPGGQLLAKWLPVFFVPGLASLPLQPSMGSAVEIGKVLGVVIIGFLFTLSTTASLVLGLRTMQGLVKDAPAPVVKKVDASSGPPPKPFSDQTFGILQKGFWVSGIASIAATRAGAEEILATPLQTIFMFFATVKGYVWGARLPPDVTKVVHPLVISTAFTLLIIRLTAFLTGSTFIDVLSAYKAGTMEPLKTGAGDILLYLLGPTVVSLSTAMYSRKQLMAENLPVVLAAMLCSSVGGLFGTAAFVRAISLGGSEGNVLRLSVIPRNVTTALAMIISSILGGNISYTASVVIMTGIFGATFGGRILTALGIEDPVSRGLGIGAAAQGLGVASFINEKDAFPFAAISMILNAVGATTLASIPPVKDVLIAIAGAGASAAADA